MRACGKAFWRTFQMSDATVIWFKGPMSWPFLLIIIPLLRYTKIDLYCAIFQTHIGFSYSISVLYVYSPVFTLCPKRLVGAPAPPLPVSPVCSDWSGLCCCEEQTGFRVGDTARTS